VTNETSVRLARPDDLDFVRQDGYVPAEVAKRKIDLQEAVVAERGGQRVGYMRLEYLWSLVPYIAMIRVQVELRRQGIGTAMLHFAEAFLRERGHTALYSSSQANEPEPQAWHRRMGFEECGIITGINESGIGEVFFRKHLA